MHPLTAACVAAGDDSRYSSCNRVQWAGLIVEYATYIPPAGKRCLNWLSAGYHTENQSPSVLCHASLRPHQIQAVLRPHLSPFSRASDRKHRECPSSSRGMHPHSRYDVHMLAGMAYTWIEGSSRPRVWLHSASGCSFRASVHWVSL